jgi:hypothetical protein
VAGAGVIQLEIGAEHARWRNDDEESLLVLVPIVGITPRIELSVEAPFRLLEPDEGPSAAGPGDVLLVGKFVAFEEQPMTPAFTLRGTVKTDSGSEARGLGTGTWDFGVAAVATKTFSPVTLHAMLGYTFVTGDRDDEFRDGHFFGVAIDWAVMGPLRLAAEVTGNRQLERAIPNDPVSGLLGLIYQVADKLALDAGVRRGFNDAAPRWAFFAGASLTF